MGIKHLVISGGGPILLQIIASIQQLELNNVINLSEIETIYGTSAGAVIGVFICLRFDWETINDYVIKRPWHELFQIKAQNIFDLYNNKGFFDVKIIEKCFQPLFDAKDISMDINLKDFFDLTKIELHFFSFELNKYKIEDVSYITHPTLSLITAVKMTSCVPLFFTPIFINDNCFIDGAVSCNYPLQHCINSGKNPDEIFGFKKNLIKHHTINNNSTIIDFVLCFLYKALFSVNTDDSQKEIKNELTYDINVLSYEVLINFLNSIENRRGLFDEGLKIANDFIEGNKIMKDTIDCTTL